MPSVDGNAKRETSGLGGSTLMTSAPRSCNVRAHRGPASTREKSTTRIPLRGPLMSAPRELGKARPVLAERCKAGLQIFRCPDRRLDPCHRFVGGGDAVVDGDMRKLLGRGMGQRRALRKLLGDRQGRFLELLFRHREVDQTPFLQRRRVVAPCEHRHFLGAQRPDPLDLTLDSAEQRMKPQRRLYRADLRGRRGNDVVAGQGKLEPSAEANAVYAGDQRDRQQLHEAQEFDTVQPAVLAALVGAAGGDALVENVEISTCGEMPQAAADDDSAAGGVPRSLNLLHDRIDEFRAQQIVGPIDHRQNRNMAALLARYQRILGQGMPPVSGASTRASSLGGRAYIMTCILQVKNLSRAGPRSFGAI